MKVTIQFKRKTGRTAIILYYKCSNGYLKYYTGESAVNQQPDKAAQARVNAMVALIDKTHSDYRLTEKSLSVADLKNILDRRFRKENSQSLTDLIEAAIDKMKEGKILTPGKKIYSQGSIKTFNFTNTLLKEFFKTESDRVTMDTYNNFIAWCQGKKYSINYIGSQIKNWKALGRLATGDPIYSSKDFKKIQEETFDIYLTEEELKKIYNLKLTGRFDLTRDWFILDCYTGLRVSDLKLLTDKNLHGGFITIANEKTDEKVIIPVHPFVAAILKKYKGFPPKISDVELNKSIKLIAEKAKIKDKVLYSITKGGKREDHYLKKWEMVSNHTARRSFITNLLKIGTPHTITMKLTGIKSMNTLLRYNKLSADEAAKIAAGHKFFK